HLSSVRVTDLHPGNSLPRPAIRQENRFFPAPEDPLVRPFTKCSQHREQRFTLRGEVVLGISSRLARIELFENSVIDQVFEPAGKDVLGNAETALELAEAREPEERIANDEQAPPVPECLQGLGDPAVHVVEAFTAHGSDCNRTIWLQQATSFDE